VSAPLLVALPGAEDLAAGLATALGAEPGRLEVRRFPDGESYLRYLCDPAGRDLVLLARLDRPDERFLPLAFAAAAARDLGARRVGLVAPYLAYMRQDTRFRPGEAVTSEAFARHLSSAVDWLVTVDPHLHRHATLGELYRIPARAAHSAPLLSAWIAREVARPLVIGPDEESAQWAAAVAESAGAPWLVLRKHRRGDREVEIEAPGEIVAGDCTPVLVDDIVSTARTLIEALRLLRGARAHAAVCLAVHGIFAGDAYRELLTAGAARVVTCNSVAHETNAIDLTPLLAEAARKMLE